MLSYRINNFLRHTYACTISNCRSFASTSVETDIGVQERDPAPYFFNRYVQSYLKRLTTVDYTKIFRTRKDGHRLKAPEYKFLTDEELQEATKAAERRAQKYLQMPPVVKQRVDSSVLLCEDPALKGHDTAKYIFTDITYDLNDRERSIVVREPEGTLRHATWQERDRIIQIYFPKPAREIEKPKMFEGEYLKDLLDRNEYIFILDRACVQFEPDDPDYQAVTREVYEYINREKHFDILRSTRHFGPMVFHLAWTKNIDNLLCEMIETERIEQAAILIRLLHLIYPSMKSAIEECNVRDNVEFIMHYARLEEKSIVEKLLQSYKELQQVHQIVQESIKQEQEQEHSIQNLNSETEKVNIN
ncbi:28S ribosomal protein S22, mitochondrial [Camponotus japonicus]